LPLNNHAAIASPAINLADAASYIGAAIAAETLSIFIHKAEEHHSVHIKLEMLLQYSWQVAINWAPVFCAVRLAWL